MTRRRAYIPASVEFELACPDRRDQLPNPLATFLSVYQKCSGIEDFERRANLSARSGKEVLKILGMWLDTLRPHLNNAISDSLTFEELQLALEDYHHLSPRIAEISDLNMARSTLRDVVSDLRAAANDLEGLCQ
ncbi:MAG: hypothetical protein AAF357_15790 [Verrucomicrobiota bacterium]